MMSGMRVTASALKEHACEKHRGQRQVEHRDGHRADSHADARDHWQAGPVREDDSERAADEQGRKDRAATEAAQREAVGEPLAHDRSTRAPTDQPAADWMSPGSWSWPEKRTSEEPLPVISANATASPATPRPTTGVKAMLRRSTIGWRARPSRRMPAPSTAATTPIAIAQRNSAAVGAAEGRDIRDRQRERPVARPGVQPDEDEGAHAGREESRDEHDAEHRAGEPGRLHEQERPDERGAEQRADRREAACGADHGDRLGRRVLLDQVHREDADAAADRDQRRLGPEHDAEAQGRERREHDPGKLDRHHGAAGLEALGRLVAGGARQVADRQRDEKPGERRPRKRPPHRLGVEPELLRQASRRCSAGPRRRPSGRSRRRTRPRCPRSPRTRAAPGSSGCGEARAGPSERRVAVMGGLSRRSHIICEKGEQSKPSLAAGGTREGRLRFLSVPAKPVPVRPWRASRPRCRCRPARRPSRTCRRRRRAARRRSRRRSPRR